MQPERLKALIEAELGQMDRVVHELTALRAEVGDETPTLRNVVAAGGFLAQFYTGIENILKRLLLRPAMICQRGNAGMRHFWKQRAGLLTRISLSSTRSLRPTLKITSVFGTSSDTATGWTSSGTGL